MYKTDKTVMDGENEACLKYERQKEQLLILMLIV